MKQSASVFKAALTRQHHKELADVQADSTRLIEEMETDCVRKLEAMSSDRREDLVRLAAARKEAALEAASFERQFQEQQAATTRLRSARNQSSLDRMEELEAKLRVASQRRKVNQRTVQDCNLAIGREQVTKKQAAKEKAKFDEFIGTGIDCAARSKQLDAENAALLAQLASVQQELKEQQAETAKHKAVAEPGKGCFYESAHFSAIVDRACIESLSLGVSRNKVPHLFLIFARLFGIKLPGRMKKVPGPRVDGKRTTVERFVLYTPGASHVKEMAAVMNQLNKLQVRVLPHTLLSYCTVLTVTALYLTLPYLTTTYYWQMGEWLLQYIESDETSCCYLADGAESQQVDYLGQLLARRSNGKLEIKALDLNALGGKSSEAQAAAFTASLQEVAEVMVKAGQCDERAAELIRRFLPTCSMNDRASPARKAARLALGLPDGDDDPTCAEHALANILEEGRKAMDAILREMMNITEAQAATDADKIKAMRTCVGWFSSPACALIYQVAKYVALCSSKGYAIGQKFVEWMEARLADVEEQTAELLGHSEDLLAICGGRMYVFYLDAAPTERLLSQEGSLLTYLQEEADLGAEGGGKLRNSILTGASSDPCMAAVRAMALICDAVFWPLIKAVKPGADKHTLDVLPTVWPKALEFFRDAAERPRGLIDGSLRLELGTEAAAAPTASQAKRSARSQIDMKRIRGKATGDPLIERLLAAACKAMAAGTENHAAEFLGPNGKLCTAKITPELRAKYDALPTTSTSVERLHAFGRIADDQAGLQRADTRAGVCLAKYNGQADWLRGKSVAELRQLLNISRPTARALLCKTLKQQRVEAGRAKRADREAKLSAKRSKRAKAAEERQRVEALTVATKYSEVAALATNAELSDQLKYHKLVRKAAGFTVTHTNRTAYVLQLQVSPRAFHPTPTPAQSSPSKPSLAQPGL
jgi:hypothetical protein